METSDEGAEPLMPSFSTQTTRSPLALALALALLFAAAANVAAQQPSPQPSQTPASAPAAAGLSPHRQLLRDIYRQLIEINTTDSAGSTTEAAEAMAARLRAAGFPASDVQVLVPAGNARKGNLVARLRSTAATTRKPLLLLAHIDVVEARKEDWSNDLDPFRLTER